MQSNTTVLIDGKLYDRISLSALPRDPEVRKLARWLHSNSTEHSKVDREWIGQTGKFDLIEFILSCAGPLAGTWKKPVTEPVVAPAPVANAPASMPAIAPDASQLIQQAIGLIASQTASSVNVEQLDAKLDETWNKWEERLEALTGTIMAKVHEAMHEATKVVRIEVAEREPITLDGLRHCNFDDLLEDILAFEATGQTNKCNMWIVGEAGTGKTTAAELIAQKLGLELYSNGAIDSEYKLRGFIDANGRIVSTPFRRAYTDGGLYLFDEADASLPSACLAFNSALANGSYDFPGDEKATPRNKRCFIVATANTWNGPNGSYVGRMRQDKAFLDRFIRVPWVLDENLEGALCQNKAWHNFVKACRANVRKHGMEHMVSPRATFAGDILLAAGRPWARAVEVCVRKGLDDTEWEKVIQGVAI